ncbi:MAG: hypothetical protein ACO23H_12180 [Alphaproteobacteria bacterium]
MNKMVNYTITKQASEFVRDTVDQIYLHENYHCCTTAEWEIWHIGSCCEGRCDKPCCASNKRQGQIMTCHEFWSRKPLVAQHMKNNDFLHNLRRKGTASCVMQVRKAHMLWGHGNRIYNKQIPDHLVDELVAGAKAQNLFSKSLVLGLYINEKMLA